MMKPVRTGILALTLLVCLPAQSGATRWPVVLEGDSITEAQTLRSGQGGWGSWGSMIQAELAKRGVRTGGYGFVPMHGALQTGPQPPWTWSGNWLAEGIAFQSNLHSDFGADGLPSTSSDPQAEASINWTGNRIGVSHAACPGCGRFTISVDGTPFGVDGSATTPGSRLIWRSTGSGSHTLRVSGITGGMTLLSGVVIDRNTTAKPQVEVDQIGHGGDFSSSNIATAQLQALEQLQAKVTVILFGTNEEGFELAGWGPDASRRIYMEGLLARAGIARRSGTCLIVPHAPNQRPKAIQAAYASVARQAATKAKCSYAPVFDGIWSGSASKAKGLTFDGIHPTAAGYSLMTKRLVTRLLPLMPR